MNPISLERRLALAATLLAGTLLCLLALDEQSLPGAQAQVRPSPVFPTALRPTRTPTRAGVVGTSTPTPSAVEFSRPEQADDPALGSVFISRGLFTNGLKQTFVITVTGLARESILDYTSRARLYLEAYTIAAKAQPASKESPDVESRTKIFRENSENLLIEFDLALTAEEKVKAFPRGYGIFFLVDPTIKNGVTHDYWQRCLRSASATIDLRQGEGRVAGWLIRAGKPAPTRVVAAPGNGALATPSPASTALQAYDLAVRGWQTPTPGRTPQSKYQVSGSWLKTYNDAAPGGGVTPCP